MSHDYCTNCDGDKYQGNGTQRWICNCQFQKLEAENVRLREALEFYANERNYISPSPETAKKALEESK